MSAGGVTTLELQVRADKRGLEELQTAFSSLNASIAANLDKLGKASRAAAAGGAQELAAMKAQLDEVKGGMATLQQLVVETGKKGEEAARKRAEATNAATEASKRSHDAMRAEAMAARDLHSGLRGLAGGLGALWTTYGSFLPLVTGFAISAGLKKAVDMGSEFTYQMQFAGAVSDASAEEIKKLSGEFENLSMKGQQSATDIAKGYRTLAQAGFTAGESLKIMPDLLKFSTVGEIEMGKAAEIAAGQMHAFGLTVDQIPHMLDSTAKAAAISQTTISEMGQALRQSSTVAQQFGVNIDEMNALLAILAQRNIRGSAAGTALRNMMNELDPSTAKAKMAFKELGVQVTDSEGRFKKIIPLIQEFAAKFDGYNQVSQQRLANSLFNERGAKAFLNAIAAGRGELQKFFETLQKSDGYLAGVSTKIEDTFKVRAKEALNAFEVSAIDAFKAVGPVLISIADQVKSVFQSQEFKDGLATALSGVAHLTGFLIEHGKAILVVAGGWVALRTAIGATNALVGGVTALAGAVNALRTAMAGLAAVGGASSIAAAGAAGAAVATGLVGAALFGGLGVGYLISQLDVVKSATQKFIDWVMEERDREATDESYYSGDRRTSRQSAALDRRQAMQAQIRARLQAEQQRSSELRTFRQMEIDSLNAPGGMQGYGNANVPKPGSSGKNWDPDAIKEAQRQAQAEVSLEIAKYQQLTNTQKAYFDNSLSALRAYNAAGLIDSKTMGDQEVQTFVAHKEFEHQAFLEHVNKLLALRAKVGDDAKQKEKVDAEIAKAYEERLRRLDAYQKAIATDSVKAWKEYNDQGKAVIENSEKANRQYAFETQQLRDLSTAKKDETLTRIEGRLKLEEETLARLEATTAGLQYAEMLTASQQADLKEVEVIRERIAKLREEAETRKGLLKERKETEDDWRVGAVKGLNDYLDHSLSTAKVMENGFKKAFSAMEDMLVDFITTGKFNFKSFADSVIKDVVRMLVQANITKPLAEGIRGLFAGGGGGAAGGVFSLLSLFGGGASAAGASAGGGGGFSLANILGAGNSLTNALGLTQGGGLLGALAVPAGTALMGLGGGLGAFGGGLAMAGQVGAFGGFNAGLGFLGAGNIASGLGAMLPMIGAVLAVGSLLYSIFGKQGGGPKTGASAFQSFDAHGLLTNANAYVPGTDNGRFFTPSQGDTQLNPAVNGIAGGYYSELFALGGRAPTSASFGLGYDTDPHGTSGSRTSAAATINGQEVYSHRDVKVDDKEIQNALTVEAEREILAALQHSDLPGAVSKILNTITDVANASKEDIDAVIKKAHAMADVINETASLESVLNTLKGGPIAAIQEQMKGFDDAVTKASNAFDAALASKDPEKVMSAEQALKQAIMNRYNTELQMVHQLEQSIRQTEENLYQFQIGMAQRIASVGGANNVADIAIARARGLRAQVDSGESLAYQVEDIQGYTGAIDTWYQTRRSQIEQDAQRQSQQMQAYAQSQAAAAQARVDQLNNELNIAKQFSGVLDGAKKMLLEMQTSSSNPLPAEARLAIQKAHVDELRKAYDAAQGTGKIDAANNLMEALQQYRDMGQQLYQRPSAEWQAIYNEISSELTKISGDSKTHADVAIDLQQQLLQAQREQNSWSETAANASVSTDAAMEALNAEALPYYTWAQTEGTRAYTAQRNAERSQLEQITHGVSLQVFEAQMAQDSLKMLTNIHDRMNDFIKLMGGDGASGSAGNPAARGTTINLNITAGPDVTTSAVVNAIGRVPTQVKRILATA